MPVVSATRAVLRYVGDVMGDNDYQRYVALQHKQHPGEPIVTERQYWQMRYDETTPTARCC